VFFKGLIPCCFATQRALQITNGQAKMCRVTLHVQEVLGAAEASDVVCVGRVYQVRLMAAQTGKGETRSCL
jgi:hypothetical protein